MKTRTQLTISVTKAVDNWIREEASIHRFSVSEYICYMVADVISVKSSLTYTKQIKRDARIGIAVPIEQVITLYGLAKDHKTTITKWIAAVLTDAYNNAHRKSNDELAAISLTQAVISYMDATGGSQPEDVDGWEGMLYMVLLSLRQAKQSERPLS